MSAAALALAFLLAAPRAEASCAGPASSAKLGPGDFAALAGPSPLPSEPGRPAAAVVADLAPGGRARVLSACRWPHPYDYLRASGLTSDVGHALTENLRSPDRRLLVGFVSEAEAGGWELALWPDDEPSVGTLRAARPLLAAALGSAPAFRPATGGQESAAAAAGYRVLPVAGPPSPVQLLSPGTAVGRLRTAGPFSRSDVALLASAPGHMPDAAGLIVGEPTTELSHLSLLARSFGLPAASVRGALAQWAALEGEPVRLTVSSTGVFLEAVGAEALAEADAARAARPRAVLLSPDLEWSELTPLSEQRAGDAARFGAKSANLGEAARAGTPGLSVPAGFTVPFHWYARFLRANRLDESAAALLAEPPADPAARAAALAALREAVRAGRHEPAFSAAFRRALASLGAGGVYVRSSTNAEDLPGFVGAGLYDTVPNAVGAEAALEAVKAVWASLYNERAWEARERAGLDHGSVYPAVLVQRAVSADAAGVLAVPDPARPGELSARIAAKHGQGARVVDGGAPAEDWLYRAEGGTAERTRPSGDASRLTLEAQGGLSLVPAPAGPVLTAEVARSLGQAGMVLRRYFGSGPLDIEWASTGGALLLLQVRPLPN